MHDLHASNNNVSSRGGSARGRINTSQRVARDDRLNAALSGSASSPALKTQFNIVTSKPTSGISIRGLAGPYTVVAQNFAPGTTAADIESAMVPIGGAVVSCRLISARPTVIAEISFESKEGADNVIDTFNNQTVKSTADLVGSKLTLCAIG